MVLFGLFYVFAIAFLYYFRKLTKTELYMSHFLKEEEEDVKLDYFGAIKAVKGEAIGIFITMALCFCAWPAIFFSNYVRSFFFSYFPHFWLAPDNHVVQSFYPLSEFRKCFYGLFW